MPNLNFHFFVLKERSKTFMYYMPSLYLLLKSTLLMQTIKVIFHVRVLYNKQTASFSQDRFVICTKIKGHIPRRDHE